MNFNLSQLRFTRRTLFIISCCAGFSVSAEEKVPDNLVLALNTGGHLATITDVAFTSDGERIVSGSKDKTVRVWNVSSGQQELVIRGQTGQNRNGQIYALAVSPDNKSVTVGGWFGKSDAFQPCCGDIRQFDLTFGKLQTVFRGHTGPVSDIAYSRKAGFLLSGSSNGEVFLWPQPETMPDGPNPQTVDFHIPLAQGMAPILKVGFLADDQTVVAVGRNGEVAFIDLEQRKVIRSVMTTPGQLVAADIGLTENIVSVADQEAVVTTWSPKTDEAIARIEAGGFFPGSLTLYDNDTKVVITCGFNCSGARDVLLWDIANGELVGKYSAHDNTVLASALSPDGLSLVTTGGERNELHVWRPGQSGPERRMASLVSPVWAVEYVSATRSISWGTKDPCPRETYCPTRERSLKYRFRLPEPGEWMDDPELIGSGEVNRAAPVTTVGSWHLQAARGGKYNLPGAILEVFKLGDKVAKLEKSATNGELHMAFSMSKGGESFFSGSLRGEINQYVLNGGQLINRFVGGHFDALLAVSDDVGENLLLTGGADQRLAIWNRSTGELIANIVFAEDGNWIIWVPQGYFYSSPDGDQLVGWHINQGPDREARYLTARQLRRHLFSPEIIRRALELMSARLAIEELRPNDNRLSKLLSRPAPAFTMDIIKNDPTVPQGYARVRIKWDSIEGRLEDEVRFYANNRHVETATARSLTGRSELEGFYDIKLVSGENAINVSIANKFGYVTERGTFEILEDTEPKPNKGRLFVIVVGVNDYPELLNTCSGSGGSCDLKYAVKDATAFLETVNDKVSVQFVESTQLQLINGGEIEPTGKNIKYEIEDFLEEATAEDMTLIFFAGHGVNVQEDYYFVPTDGKRKSKDRWRRSSLVEWSFLRKVLEYTKGTRMLFLDTCHSGNAYNARLVKDTADARVVVFSAAKSNQFALETQNLKHGLFTYSIVSGLNGEADLYKDQSIRLLELATYVSAKVNTLSGNRQSPEYYLSGLDDFLLAQW